MRLNISETEEYGTGLNMPVFVGDNAALFKTRMESKLCIKDVFDAIEPGPPQKEKGESEEEFMARCEKEIKGFKKLNMKAKAYIMAGVHEDYLEHFVNLKLAKEMWVKIDEIWQSRSVATLTSKKNCWNCFH